MTVREKPTRAEALTYYRRVADHFDLNVRQHERVDRVSGNGSGFRADSIRTSGAETAWQAAAIYAKTQKEWG